MHFHSHSNSGNSFITQECKAKIPFHFNTKQQKNEIIYPIQIFLNKHNKNTYKKNTTLSFNVRTQNFVSQYTQNFAIQQTLHATFLQQILTTSNNFKQHQTIQKQHQTKQTLLATFLQISLSIVHYPLFIVHCQLSITFASWIRKLSALATVPAHLGTNTLAKHTIALMVR